MTVVDFTVSCVFQIRQRNAESAADIHTLPRCSIRLCDEHDGPNVLRLHSHEFTVVAVAVVVVALIIFHRSSDVRISYFRLGQLMLQSHQSLQHFSWTALLERVFESVFLHPVQPMLEDVASSGGPSGGFAHACV